MKRTMRLIRAVLAIGSCFVTICMRHDAALADGSSPSGSATQSLSDQNTNRLPASHLESNGTNQTKHKIDWEAVKKDTEERFQHPHPSDWPLPNFQAGPGRPPPNYLNFYRMDDRFPSYLLCEYPVEEERYDQTNEAEWFKAALKQVRRSGPKKFPPLKWVAVAIRNVAEHKDASTFERSFKVGAIFNANDVFDSSRVLSQLVARAAMDRHPFMYDPKQPPTGEDQRWLIVERHAAVAGPTTGAN